MGTGSLVLAASGVASTYTLLKLAIFLLKPYFSPIRYVPGPDAASASFVTGHMRTLWEPVQESPVKDWMLQYGHILKYKGFFNVNTRVLVC